MSSELDDVARSLFLGLIPNIWRKLAPDTLKSLGNWMVYFLRRFSQYTQWVSDGGSRGVQGSASPWVSVRVLSGGTSRHTVYAPV